jgi:hypothetical protein
MKTDKLLIGGALLVAGALAYGYYVRNKKPIDSSKDGNGTAANPSESPLPPKTGGAKPIVAQTSNSVPGKASSFDGMSNARVKGPNAGSRLTCPSNCALVDMGNNNYTCDCGHRGDMAPKQASFDGMDNGFSNINALSYKCVAINPRTGKCSRLSYTAQAGLPV